MKVVYLLQKLMQSSTQKYRKPRVRLAYNTWDKQIHSRSTFKSLRVWSSGTQLVGDWEVESGCVEDQKPLKGENKSGTSGGLWCYKNQGDHQLSADFNLKDWCISFEHSGDGAWLPLFLTLLEQILQEQFFWIFCLSQPLWFHFQFYRLPTTLKSILWPGWCNSGKAYPHKWENIGEDRFPAKERD